jgi:hypothetical protein
MSYYKGQQGALRYIVDITDDNDGCNTIESLKQLILEVRQEAIRALNEKDDYNVKGIKENV